MQSPPTGSPSPERTVPTASQDAGQLALRVLGAGNSGAAQLGNAAALIERGERPLLLIDCGFDTLPRLQACHPGSLPEALFITHCHLDHVGGMEGLFHRLAGAPPLRLYVPYGLVALLHRRIGSYPGALAEGGANFWDRFQMVPVGDHFWHAGLRFQVFATRHHEPGTSFGLALPGVFVWTGDTRPIPEVLQVQAPGPEWVFHDCALAGNPSHSGIDDLQREYPPALLERLVAYHYESEQAGEALRARGVRVARPGERFEFGAAADDRASTLVSLPLPPRQPDAA